MHTHIGYNAVRAWDIYSRHHVSREMECSYHARHVCMPMERRGDRGKGEWRDVVNVNEGRFYSRFDLGSRRSPLSDELLTTLHNLGIPRLLVG
jgi:hypothetical protein